MNIDRINSIMLSASHMFQAAEIEAIRSEGEVALEGLEAPIAQMSREIAAEVGKPVEEVIDVVSSVLAEAAAQRFGPEGITEEAEIEAKLVDWMASGGATPLAQQVVEQLQAA